jgi:hypothetical protein
VKEFGNARLIEVENAGHDILFSDSHLLVAELRQFLQAVDAELKSD